MAALAVRLIYKLRQNHHDGLMYLAGFYIALTGFWAFRAMPGILTDNPYTVMATNLVSYVFLYVATTSLLQVPFIFIDRRHWGVILGILNVMVGLIFVIGRFLNPVPHLPIVIVPYVFWQETYPLLLRALTGISTFTSTTIFMGVFFYLGHKERDNTIIYRRSMYLASGMLFLVLASFIFFLASTGGFVVSILASGSCIVGAYLMLRGISYESPKEPAVPPTP
ncbi:hypothetical protein A2936_02070 [Candidatus Uhrbacteria bacterium RIFCSPLOWO2_01_FULL_47_25]|uniref:Histidine kinase N-terminal 7TM region domain-containing protein n=1 Tax=Candidatus Uhrbacteria bacterium RIFCSPLOWO2_01_FULL_47_25 TaxID=1802402 RepID=A0A1F7UW20_9BACT|nr:MAG: hypothetical protein A2936_02070 [Candidatus Uhrbacteria bacterium RIFCSPLOWO2_01_FULL_47_25]OGL85247.1 MAG: hypothetical protein A3I37_02870 [Candidatus Uhrbacteria bacterium RIFCSPLOWO2_02_FULL_46_19]